MDPYDCLLRVKVNYGNKNFKMESLNIIKLEQIKNLSLEKFGLKKEEKELLSFEYQNQNSERFVIKNENDLINYADQKDSALEINIYLNLNTHKNEIIASGKIGKDNSEEISNNLNEEYENQIKELKEENESLKNIKIELEESNQKLKDTVEELNKNNKELQISLKDIEEKNKQKIKNLKFLNSQIQNQK